MMRNYPPDWDQRRREVYPRDRYQCQNCGRRGGRHGDHELHCHHIVPKGRGGVHDLTNLITLCKACHDAVHKPHVARADGSPRGGSIDAAEPDRKSIDPCDFPGPDARDREHHVPDMAIEKVVGMGSGARDRRGDLRRPRSARPAEVAMDQRAVATGREGDTSSIRRYSPLLSIPYAPKTTRSSLYPLVMVRGCMGEIRSSRR